MGKSLVLVDFPCLGVNPFGHVAAVFGEIKCYLFLMRIRVQRISHDSNLDVLRRVAMVQVDGISLFGFRQGSYRCAARSDAFHR